MAHSYVEFRDQAQLMHDVEIVTVVHILLNAWRALAELPDLTDSVVRLLESWCSLIDVYAPGCIDIDLGQYLSSERDRQSMLGFLSFVRGALERSGPVVSGDYLNHIVDAPGALRFVDRPTVQVLAMFDRFARVLRSVDEHPV